LKNKVVNIHIQHFVSKNPFAIAFGSCDNVNEVFGADAVLSLEEECDIAGLRCMFKWLKQLHLFSNSTYDMGVLFCLGMEMHGGVHVELLSSELIEIATHGYT
jgi:hypothetical protein